MRNFLLFFVLLLLAAAEQALAQEPIIHCTDSTFCVPSVYGMPRTKGIEIKQERVMDYRIHSSSDPALAGNNTAEVSLNRRWRISVRAPLLLREGIKVAIGIRYFHEEYRFENISTLDYPFYQSLEDKSLKSFGGALYVIKPFLGNKYLLFRVSANLNGDYFIETASKKDFLKFSISPLMGWKKGPYLSYAAGLAYSYDFGSANIYPIFSYNRTFNEHWGLESILPVQVKFRYRANDKNFVYLITELNGANYRIQLEDDPVFGSVNDLHLNKSEIRFLASYEREIHDWLWMNVEAGVRANFDFSLHQGPGRRAPELIDNNFKPAMVISGGIFIVPPRKFLN